MTSKHHELIRAIVEELAPVLRNWDRRELPVVSCPCCWFEHPQHARDCPRK